MTAAALVLAAICAPAVARAESASPTEGTITAAFVDEAAMQADLLQMLANFSTYMKNDYEECVAPNSKGEDCGCFKGENTMANDERGVRPNADLSMICAFLVKYGRDKVTLPEGVTWTDLETLARKSLVFAYSTHKANKYKVCKGNNYWGSTSNNDHVWESSLWAMSVAYSAFFQWDKLTDTDRNAVKALLKAECQYELERSIPTGFSGDTKAEENGWEADVLAATLGLFPNDELAPRWFDRLRAFAINSYSHASDAENTTVIDPDYDQKTVADFYKGRNLYDDYTLQNHNLFHTSYQNVVMQELGEAALALKLFQTELYGNEQWKTNALMHNNQKVMDQVLNQLAMPDGELAMPNGNDWSLFLFDQITSYSTMACFLDDPNALMLENMAYKYIKARQTTTDDGSWLLRADVGARRMGVEAHRVMMTWLMHHVNSTASLTPTTWDDFNAAHSEALIFPSQNVVRASTDDRFSCFSWSSGLKSYTGYFAPNSPDRNKIVVPYRANNTGNLLGWFKVDGKATDATPVLSGVYQFDGKAYVMNGELNTNGSSLNNRFAIYSTPKNALIYIDLVRAASNVTVSGEFGGLLAVSVDPFMKEQRTLAYNDHSTVTDGTSLTKFTTDHITIDDFIGIVAKGNAGMAFGERANNNSILTAKLYTLYNDAKRTFNAGATVRRGNVIYYSKVSAATTDALAAKTLDLSAAVPEGWNGVIAPETDGSAYLLLANFVAEVPCTLADIALADGAPVFSVPTTIDGGKATAEFIAEQNTSIATPLLVYVKGGKLTGLLDPDDAAAAYLSNDTDGEVAATVTIYVDGTPVSGEVKVAAGKCVRVSAANGAIVATEATMPATGNAVLTEGYTEVTDTYLANPNFELDTTYGTIGTTTSLNTTYENCYINTVPAVNSDYPNILPVQGWTAANTLTSASNYCRMYSMPYTSLVPCVSPGNVGNYAALCPPFLSDPTSGKRCLTVLNSWSTGGNAITQTVALPKGKYRVLLNMKYECPSEAKHDIDKITASNGNVNQSMCGISYNGTSDYRFPDTQGKWQTVVWDFELDADTNVTFSLGNKTDNNCGAANQVTLFADNLRLYTEQASAISTVATDADSDAFYTPAGIKVDRPAHGIYISKGRKILVR